MRVPRFARREHVVAVKVPRPTRVLSTARANDSKHVERLLFVSPHFESRDAVYRTRVVWPMPVGVDTAAYLGDDE